jgi:predicted Zn-dependent protease
MKNTDPVNIMFAPRPAAVLTICLLAACACWAGCAVNPVTGEEEFMLIGEQHDKKIGSHYAPEIEKQMGGKLKDRDLQEYINSVGQKVAHASHRPHYGYQFAALNDSSVNAFALPGGYIYITRGMLEKLNAEAQLAGILAHETTHVVARHTAAAMSRQIGMLALLLGGGLTTGAGSDEMAAATVTAEIIDLRYTRADEQEADISGLNYMVRAGYNPSGMIEVMEILQDEDKDHPVEFFSTHPIPENRILYLTARIRTVFDSADQLRVGRDDYRRNVLDRLPKEPE